MASRLKTIAAVLSLICYLNSGLLMVDSNFMGLKQDSGIDFWEQFQKPQEKALSRAFDKLVPYPKPVLELADSFGMDLNSSQSNQDNKSTFTSLVDFMHNDSNSNEISTEVQPSDYPPTKSYQSTTNSLDSGKNRSSSRQQVDGDQDTSAIRRPGAFCQEQGNKLTSKICKTAASIIEAKQPPGWLRIVKHLGDFWDIKDKLAEELRSKPEISLATGRVKHLARRTFSASNAEKLFKILEGIHKSDLYRMLLYQGRRRSYHD